MKNVVLFMVGVPLLVCVTSAGAVTPDQRCDQLRAKAQGKYVKCVEDWLAKVYAGTIAVGDDTAQISLARCKNRYAQTWIGFQANSSLASSACIDPRFTDDGDRVTDKLTGLVWEKKTDLDGTATADPHDADNTYTWSTGTPFRGDGTAFTTLLTDAGTGLNVVGFAGANDWRLPTLAELMTILRFAPYPCSPSPCVADPLLDTTKAAGYDSATTTSDGQSTIWRVNFTNGTVAHEFKTSADAVRAVRGGE